jgi:hypothetical protein
VQRGRTRDGALEVSGRLAPLTVGMPTWANRSPHGPNRFGAPHWDDFEAAMQTAQRVVVSLGQLGGDLGLAAAKNILTR